MSQVSQMSLMMLSETGIADSELSVTRKAPWTSEDGDAQDLG